MKKAAEFYTDLDGREWDLTSLDAEERRLVADLRRRAETHPDWNDLDNYWMQKVTALYEGRGVPRKVSSRKAVYRIASDLSSRMAVSQGLARLPDFRDDLLQIILEKFETRSAFCAATGLAEDMLDPFLAGRKPLSIDALADALARIDYRLCVLPTQPAEQTHPKRKTRAG